VRTIRFKVAYQAHDSIPLHQHLLAKNPQFLPQRRLVLLVEGVVLELMPLMSMVILLVVPLLLLIATVMLVEMMALVSIRSAASGDRTGSL
jgi:hypothetical protein